MADSMKTQEIEDVLTSIRRLVSEDLRPAPRPLTRPAGRLVLTPALRVEAPVASPGVLRLTGAALVRPPSGGDAGYVEEIETPPAPAPEVRGHWTAETMPEVTWLAGEEPWEPSEPLAFVAHRRVSATPVPQADDAIKAEMIRQLAAEALLEETAEDPAAPSGQGAAPDVLVLTDPALPMDEGLRDMVRQIIRDELAGPLGERITRNVRKLVRIELRRALAARDFE